MLQVIERLRQTLSSLPGIGGKSALKLAMHLVDMPASRLDAFLSEIRNANDSVLKCECCGDYVSKSPCDSCLSEYPENGILCIVENSFDTVAIAGCIPCGSKFHVLGGKLSPVNGVGPEELNLAALQKRLTDGRMPGEIMIATGSDVEGEATAAYLFNLLKQFRIKISRIAFGVSVGRSISASDERSIQKSIAGRIFY